MEDFSGLTSRTYKRTLGLWVVEFHRMYEKNISLSFLFENSCSIFSTVRGREVYLD